MPDPTLTQLIQQYGIFLGILVQLLVIVFFWLRSRINIDNGNAKIIQAKQEFELERQKEQQEQETRLQAEIVKLHDILTLELSKEKERLSAQLIDLLNQHRKLTDKLIDAQAQLLNMGTEVNKAKIAEQTAIKRAEALERELTEYKIVTNATLKELRQQVDTLKLENTQLRAEVAKIKTGTTQTIGIVPDTK